MIAEMSNVIVLIEHNTVITIKCNEHPTILFPYFD